MEENPIDALLERLGNHPELRFISTPSSVKIEAPSSEGFSVALYAATKNFVVHYDGWHEHFASASDALDCVAFAYSGECRLAVTYRGRIPVKWVLESRKDGSWHADSEVGHFFVPFWIRARVEYRKNPVFLSPKP